MKKSFKNLWFLNPDDSIIYINETAVRIRAGILLIIPLYMGLTLYDVGFASSWIVDDSSAVDTYYTDFKGSILYSVEAVKRTYEYSLQSAILLYALFEMLAGLFVITSRLSPTILLSSILAGSHPPVWKPLVPKRYAWAIGSSLISLCLIFFNPDTFAEIVNFIGRKEVLPTTVNYLSTWVPLILVWICIGFMWMEAVLGFCAGCKVHSLLVYLGIHKEECEACNNINWDTPAD